MSPEQKSKFQRVAAAQRSPGVVKDILAFAKENKKWWLIPFVVIFVVLGALIFFAGTGAAPFIYTLF